MAGILVVSAPRSGSSCTTGLLYLHGFPLGYAHSLHTDEYNEKGYFENDRFLNFNRNVLQEIGVDVFCTEHPTESQHHRYMTNVNALSHLWEDQFGHHKNFLIKDPRIAILQDLYIAALPPFKVVLLERRAEDVAQSMQRMRGFSVEKGLHVREIYMDLMDQMAEKTDHKRVQFENLLEQMPDLCDWLGVEYKEEESRAFVEERLVHFK